MSDQSSEVPGGPLYLEGDYVCKIKGARFWGQIKGKPYLTQGLEWHYNVMAVHPDFKGTVHIMIETQIEKIDVHETTASRIYAFQLRQRKSRRHPLKGV